jgi:hypothetical protein
VVDPVSCIDDSSTDMLDADVDVDVFVGTGSSAGFENRAIDTSTASIGSVGPTGRCIGRSARLSNIPTRREMVGMAVILLVAQLLSFE